MKKKRISIIIVTYNSESDIFDCLDSIRKYADIPLSAIEIIIVDNNSNEYETLFLKLKEYWDDDNIILIENERNSGYGQGNNIGLEHSTASVSLIMNPDVRLMMPIFKSALQKFESDKKVGILGMKQMLTPDIESHNSFCCDWLTNGYWRTILCAVFTRIDWYIPSKMYVQGSCFFLRNDMFKSIGMFDETNFMYGEEEDIHYRMKLKYGSNCFAYNSKLRYIHQTVGRELTYKYEKNLIDANVRLYSKKGVSKSFILKHFLQNVNMQIWRLRLFRKLPEKLKVLCNVRKYILDELSK